MPAAPQTGLKYDEEIVDVATQKRMHDDGELEFNKLPLLRVGKFTLGESAFNCHRWRAGPGWTRGALRSALCT